MKLIRFIFDKKFLLLFYATLMTFVSLVIFYDNNYSVGLDNILYINFAGFVFLLFYLIIEYLRYKKYYDTIKYILQNNTNNLLASIPRPIDYNQQMNYEIISKLDRNYSNLIDKFRLDKKDYADFMNSWVHEIKTPISVSRLVIEGSISKSKEEVLCSLEDELNSIENYVEQALYYSRLESFSKDYLIGELNLSILVKELVKKHAKFFISKKIKIDLGNLDYRINSDKKWLFFIIDQILSNSLKYSNSNGIISIYSEKAAQEHRLVIIDNGIGIKSEDLPRVFDKGFTGTTGRNNNKSTGMGLYLARTLSEKLGHTLSIESEFGKFTKVIVHFPNLLEYHNVID
jgi:signal transduction histidine kinase